jgi:hypothetical protein
LVRRRCMRSKKAPTTTRGNTVVKGARLPDYSSIQSLCNPWPKIEKRMLEIVKSLACSKYSSVEAPPPPLPPPPVIFTFWKSSFMRRWGEMILLLKPTARYNEDDCPPDPVRGGNCHRLVVPHSAVIFF